MKNKVITDLFCVALALLTLIGSSSPIVLCVGADGHMEVEMVAHSVANPLSLSFTDNPASFCHDLNQSHQHETQSDNDCGTNDCDTSECGDCLDLIISQEDVRVTARHNFQAPVPVTAPLTAIADALPMQRDGEYSKTVIPPLIDPGRGNHLSTIILLI